MVYRLRIEPDGSMSVILATGDAIRVETQFYYPRGSPAASNPLNGFGSNRGSRESEWRLSIEQRNSSIVVTGEGRYYRVRREIDPRKGNS